MGSRLHSDDADRAGGTSRTPGSGASIHAGLVLSFVAVAGAMVFRFLSTRAWPFWDLDVYVAGARALMAGGDPYQSTVHDLLFTYPPFAAITFTPLVAAGSAAGWIVSVLSVLSVVFVVVVLGRRLRVPAPAAVLVVLAGLVLEPVTRTLVLGQINAVLMALVVADLFVVPRKWRGLLTGFATGVKLTPAIFVVYFLAKRDLRAAVQSALAFVATVGVAWLVAPEASWTYWSGRALEMANFGDYQVQSANQSLRGVLIRTLEDPDPPLWIWALMAGGVLALGWWVCGARVRAGDDVGAVLALAATGLICSPISWTHHWVWIVVAILYAVALHRYVLAWLVGLVFYVAPMWFLPAGGLVELRYMWWEVAVSATYVFVGLTGVLLLWLRRGRPPAEPGASIRAPV